MQLPSGAVKKCSQCQATAELDALLCETCGRVFPMQSASAPMMSNNPLAAPPSVTVAQARVSPARQMALGSVFLLVVAASIFGLRSWYADYSAQEAERIHAIRSGKPAPKKILPSHALPASTPNPQFSHAADRYEE